MYNPGNPFPEEMISTQPSEGYPPMEELPLKPPTPQYAVQPPPPAQNEMSAQPPQAAPLELGESSITGREEALTIKFAIGKLNDYLLWFLMVLEVTLLIEFFLMLIGAAQNNLFAGFVYEGELYVAATRLKGQDAIRLAIGNGRTTEADVRRAWEVLKACAP